MLAKSLSSNASVRHLTRFDFYVLWVPFRLLPLAGVFVYVVFSLPRALLVSLSFISHADSVVFSKERRILPPPLIPLSVCRS